MHEVLEKKDDHVPVWKRWNAGHTLFAVTTFSAVTLIAAFQKDPSTSPFTVAGFSALVGVLAGTLHARRLGLALSGVLFGLAVGISTSLDFLMLPVEGAYYAVFSSLAIYVFIGLTLGGFAEMVRFLHFVAHGGKPRDYHSRQAVK